jgi:ribosomal protein S18 acetylase RimI-like enzyme
VEALAELRLFPSGFVESRLICRCDGRFAILLGMSSGVEIVRCPPAIVREALALVLRELAPEQRREVANKAACDSGGNASAFDALFVARRGGELCGAVWGQHQAGRTAVLWVPQMTAAANGEVAEQLTQAVVRALDADNVEMTQTLLLSRTATIAPVLESAGFFYLAELLYLVGVPASTTAGAQQAEALEFIAYDDSQRSRLTAVIEQTYLDSHDCAVMNGKRQMDDVLDGYRATGVYRPENWLIVRGGGRDIGVLLLAEDPAAGHCELVYMGVVPEARGQGHGERIAKHALSLAKLRGAERVVLAVDAGNGPAVAIYGRAGFTVWDRRTVFVRFRGN